MASAILPPTRPGTRYERLVVIRRGRPAVSPSGQTHAQWWCLCDCGIGRLIRQRSLRIGETRSCGCLYREVAGRVNKTHGMRHSPEFEVWSDMRRRCRDPRRPGYRNYGARDIFVCAEWGDFVVFYHDMGPRPTPLHTIERIDNNGPYSPENCRWATRKEQSLNTRRNVRLTWKGETKTVKEWAGDLGMKSATLAQRVRQGWSAEKALTRPIGRWPK